MRTKKYPFLLMCLLIVTGLPVLSAWARKDLQRTTKVVDIRFGMIEPPVVAQSDITVRAPASNQQLEAVPLECSALAWADEQLLILSDRHDHIVFTCPLDLKKMTVGTPRPHVIIKNEQQLLRDAECMTVRRSPAGGYIVYALCSLSNDQSELPLPKRRHMLRFHLIKTDPFMFRNPLVINASTIRDTVDSYFNMTGTEPYRAFYSDFTGTNQNTYRWGNIEGITFTPEDSALLCAMRNPLHNEKAILFVVENLDETFLALNPKNLRITDIFTLDLGSRGISDISWDPLTKGYIITAAKSSGPKLSQDQPYPPNTLDGALFWWSGRKNEKPVLFAKFPDLKIEAVCRLGPNPYIAVGSDEADVSEGRPIQKQSILTIMYFTGIDMKL